MKIAVVGTGYVGLVTAVCMAEKGHDVICIDIDEEKINLLKSGKSPIYENGLEELLHKNRNRLRFTMEYQQAYSDVDVIFIGVGTPERKDGSANLTYVYAVAKEIASTVQNNCVVVVKSTVPVGTNDKIEKMLNEYKKYPVQISVVSNPEFLAQGTAVRDTLFPSRIVVGAETKEAGELIKKLYESYDAPILLTDRKSAEMIKYAANDFLALKISYINEIANLCEIVGANVEDVAKGMGYDDRIGGKFLSAGIGYGGSCFPKDTKALHWLASINDYELKTVKAAIEINMQQKMKLIKKARKYYESFEGITVAVLGLTFKPGTDDIREAPSLVNIPIFLDDGAFVRAYDPIGIPNFKKNIERVQSELISNNRILYFDNISDTIRGADLCIILTEWEQIKKYDVKNFDSLMKKSIVLDGRNCFSLDMFSSTNTIYEGIGRKF